MDRQPLISIHALKLMNDYYADAAPPPEGAAPEAKSDTSSDSNVATIPKSVLGGKEFQPGQEVVLKVEKVMEDSVLVSYASEEKPEEQEQPQEAPPAQAPGPGGGGMSSLME